jgi:hypothetical protein
MIHLMRYFYSTQVVIEDEAHPFDYEDHNHKDHILVIKKPFIEIDNIQYFSLTDLINKGWKIIWMLRDGRDVISSKLSGKYHVDHERWTFSNSKMIPYCMHDQVSIIRYENLVKDPGSVMEDVKKSIGQDYQKDYENWFNELYPDDPMNSGLAPRPISQDSIGNYKNHPERMTDSINFKKLLNLFGYDNN